MSADTTEPSEALILAIDVMDWCLEHDQPVPEPVARLVPVETVRQVRKACGLDPA